MKKRAFTLIELIAVMAIIMTLAGMVMVVSRAALDKAKKSKAESMISALSVAISMYYADCGTYPWTTALNGFGDPNIGNVSAELLDQLNNPAKGNPLDAMYTPGWKGPYIELNSGDLGDPIGGVQTKRDIHDPWRSNYFYQSRISTAMTLDHPNSFDIRSAGPDKNFNTPDDIKN